MGAFSASSDADQLAGAFARAGAELAELDAPNMRAGELIAAGTAPSRTGQLAAGVRSDSSPEGVAVFGTARYWTFVHWGAPRHNVVAQPWLLAQARTHEADLVDLYTQHATDVLGHIHT